MNKKISAALWIIFAGLMMPFWAFSYFFPRTNKTIVFGSWFGNKYSDNPMYLYEHVCSKSTHNCIWLTHKKSIRDKLCSENKTCHLIWSFSGIFYSLRAKIVIVGSGKKDVNPYFINGAIVINTWHGSPIKKIGMANDKINSPLINNLKKIFLPNVYEYNIDHIISSSSEFDKILGDAFDVASDNVLKTGYPRNDVFFRGSKTDFVSVKKIAYLPTFRDNFSDYDYFSQFQFNNKIVEFLLNNNLELHLGTHFASSSEINIKKSKCIKLIPRDPFFNLNEYLKGIDLLITDYSGIYFDFLLLGKPIILAPFDLSFYEEMCRKLYFKYDELKCYGVANNWNEIHELLTSILSKKFKKEPEIITTQYNDYNKGNSSELLYNFLNNI